MLRLAAAIYLLCLDPVAEANAACQRIDRPHMLQINLMAFNDLGLDRHDAGEVTYRDYAFCNGRLYFHATCDACHASYAALSDIEDLHARYPSAFIGWKPPF
jgi:hypothetical protein